MELGVFYQAYTVVGTIQLLVDVGLKSPFSCWLSVRDHSHLLETTLKSVACGSLHRQTWLFTSSRTARKHLLLLLVSFHGNPD